MHISACRLIVPSLIMFALLFFCSLVNFIHRLATINYLIFRSCQLISFVNLFVIFVYSFFVFVFFFRFISFFFLYFYPLTHTNTHTYTEYKYIWTEIIQNRQKNQMKMEIGNESHDLFGRRRSAIH